jgi:protein ImuB
LRLFERPEPIEVMAPVPDDPPVMFRWRGQVHRVTQAEGPERLEPEWWRGLDGLRDYYRVEDGDGHRFWLFRAGHHQPDGPARWFLHGLFG